MQRNPKQKSTFSKLFSCFSVDESLEQKMVQVPPQDRLRITQTGLNYVREQDRRRARERANREAPTVAEVSTEAQRSPRRLGK